MFNKMNPESFLGLTILFVLLAGLCLMAAGLLCSLKTGLLATSFVFAVWAYGTYTLGKKSR